MEKNRVYILIVLIMVAFIFVPITTSYAMPYFEEATVIGDVVNVRLRPTTEAPVIISLQQGDRIGVFCEEVEGWYRIVFGNYRGYISADYVFLPSADSMVGHVIEAGLNMRQNPGVNSEVVGSLTEGTGLTITNIKGDWYYAEVSLADQEGLEDHSAAAELEDIGAAAEQEDNGAAGQKEDAGTAADTETGEDILRGYVHKDFVELSSAKTASTLLKPGMSGALVRNVQQNLRKRGFLQTTATGFFGDKTETAIKEFQKRAGLKADGIVGQKTYDVLLSDTDIYLTRAQSLGVKGEVKMTSWNTVKNIFERGSKALVTDVRTGGQFWIQRYGGTLHADVEPLTKEDTAIAKKNYGGTFSWSRRAIWVTVGDETFAASMNYYPHGQYAIKDNDFPAHFCIHFKDSRLHLSGTSRAGSVCRMHQAQIKYAYEKGRE